MPPLDLNRIFEKALSSAPWKPSDVSSEDAENVNEKKQILARLNVLYAEAVVNELNSISTRGRGFNWGQDGLEYLDK